jgi:hypothetical protein
VGWDAQFQYVGDVHFFTARASYIYEWAKLDGSAFLDGVNPKNHLAEFNISATYSYDATYTVTAAYFNTQGSADPLLYPDWNTHSPNASGEVLDIGYSPWSRGGPSIWPWLNTRIGVNFTHYDKLNGSTTNYDGNNRNAKDDNTTILYAWTAF